MTRPGGRSWWAAKVRQFGGHLRARVGADERAALDAWTTPAVRALFDAMHVADRRHGLDVVATLRAEGIHDREVLVAGLLHDAGKGNTGVVARVVHALAQAYGGWIAVPARLVPGLSASLERLRSHPERSAEMAARAGCSPRITELIRWQEAPRDPEYGERLRLADEAN